MKIYIVAPKILTDQIKAKINTVQGTLKKDGHTVHSFSDICKDPDIERDDMEYLKYEIEAFNKIDYDSVAFLLEAEIEEKCKGEMILAKSLNMIILRLTSDWKFERIG